MSIAQFFMKYLGEKHDEKGDIPNLEQFYKVSFEILPR
jgi:hypothetical protein